MFKRNTFYSFLTILTLGLSATALGHANNGKNHLPLKYDDSSMHCYNPTTGVEIGFYISTEVEVYPGITNEELYRGSEKNRILISHPDGTEYIYPFSVLAMTDGDGNAQYSVSWITTEYRRVQVLNLYYDHKLGYLQGFYTPFTTDINNVDTLLPPLLVTPKMDCYTYTWGTGYL